MCNILYSIQVIQSVDKIRLNLFKCVENKPSNCPNPPKSPNSPNLLIK